MRFVFQMPVRRTGFRLHVFSMQGDSQRSYSAVVSNSHEIMPFQEEDAG